MTFTPTPEQLAITGAARNTKDSLLISALAGAAKTSTLVLVSQKLPLVPTLTCAFNKRIAEEMAKRLPGHITCATMNSLGHRAWQAKLGRRAILDTGKNFAIISDIRDRHSGEEKKLIGENLSSFMRSIGIAKTFGYIPKKMLEFGKPICTKSELIENLVQHIDCETDDFFFSVLDTALENAIAQGFDGKIDFDDQIYLSTLFGGTYQKFPIIMVDEAQDLSPLNHETLKLQFGGRLIAVGDKYQSIYGFRGAHASSMEVLKETFSMTELTLSTSFRCPRSVVRNVNPFVPHMQFPEWAEEGEVLHLDFWECAKIPDGAAIICRNNAPLFSCALRLVRSGRGVKILGGDIEKSLLKLMDKISKENCPREDFLRKIDTWAESELAKASEARKASIRDRKECLRVFAEFGEEKDTAKAYASTIFSASGPISLMTGHKAKGLEFDVVYFLEPDLIPSRFARQAAERGDDRQMQQELNLKYVINTRAKKALYYVYLEDLT